LSSSARQWLAKVNSPSAVFAHAAILILADPVNQGLQQYQRLLPLWPTEIDARVIELNLALPNGITVQFTGNLSNLRQNSAHLAQWLDSFNCTSLTYQGGQNQIPQPVAVSGCSIWRVVPAGMNLQTLVTVPIA